MGTQLANATITINNTPVPYTPNSLMFTEGLGEQTTRAASIGGGAVEQIYSQNVESNFSTISFEMPAIIGNIDSARGWKSNRNQNVIQIVGQTPEGVLTRTFTQAALLSDYEVALGSETNISMEFKANPAV